MILIILYHGTIDKYADDITTNGIILSKSKHSLDFGPGFYTTPDLDFALHTAAFRAKRYNAFHENRVGWKVVKIICDDMQFQKLKIKAFNHPDNEWGRFIIVNRCMNKAIHQTYDNNIDHRYDVVIGPTADGNGTLAPIIKKVDKLEMSLDDIDSSLFAPSSNGIWGNQISFHTPKSISCIKELCVL